MGRKGLVGEERNTGGRSLNGNKSKDLKEPKGKLKVIKGWRSEGEGKGCISDEMVWGDIKFAKEATEFQTVFSKVSPQERT